MQTIIAANPFRCRVWQMHSRLDEHVTEESCEAELRSFEAHGQLVPAIGRRLPKGGDHDIEIICGARRLFIARHFNEPLLVELREMSDREAIVAMETENGQRVDISSYERGLSYARWLREGLFGSQEEIGSALQVSRSQVSRLLKLASLPQEIIDAFGSALEIREVWGVTLASALEDAQRRRLVLQAARDLAAVSPRPPAREVFKQLCAVAEQGDEPKNSGGKVVKAENGTPLFEIKRQGNSVLVVLPMAQVSARSLKAIEASMTLIIEPCARRERAGADTACLHDAIA
jgi:ParB family transcriptional regulator, chromosome partitioning protein